MTPEAKLIHEVHTIAVELFCIVLALGSVTGAILFRPKRRTPKIPTESYGEVEFAGRRYYVRTWTAEPSRLVLELTEDLPAEYGLPLK